MNDTRLAEIADGIGLLYDHTTRTFGATPRTLPTMRGPSNRVLKIGP